MASAKPRHLLRIQYEEAAQAYLRSLPPEHFMEAIVQATQREITLESLALLKLRRPDVQVFNELLVQYPDKHSGEPRQVVPDTMVVVWPEPIVAEGSYDLPLQPTRPFWVLEYVSTSNKRKDYEESFGKYERNIKVQYYLLFYPDNAELTLYRHTGRRYSSVKPNERGRLAIPPLDLEMALVDGWVRYWYQGELLPLPADLQREVDDLRKKLRDATRQVEEQTRRAETAEKELARLRARLAALEGQESKP